MTLFRWSQPPRHPIQNAAALDYETAELFIMGVQVSDGGGPARTANAIVIVSVLDANIRPTRLPFQSATCWKTARAR